ncbi:DUF5906 domain-containing protein [Undibacterium curvum]|uniref:NrS-1 polymerase-like helicase domain-containing protein n=1 Tax=Undibacterium curvum TaxID=2762294 RepID=A0ABR7A507_9BURK|nr:DUF5906 domain-containing protein [Undibacterium curvum]MBC3931991.1 hypothetical protein [Undibacterium curvum]
MMLEEICLAQMVDAGYNNVPSGHPVLDGTIHRFGKGKKSWYIARRVSLPSGKETVSGAFGTYHGEDNGAIKFKGDVERMSDADRAALVTKQTELARIEREKEEEKHRLAANRARQQWGSAVECDHAAPHPYLVKKQVPAFGLRLSSDGDLLMPLWADGGCSPVLRGLQKIDAKGEKRFNKGIDKVGAAFHLMNIPADAELIDIGEGYATCASVLLAAPGSFVVCALDAGNLMPVAKHIRATYPNAHIRFIADDDYLLLPRFIERLREQFNLSLPDPVIDGQSRTYQAADGEPVEVTAWWRTDPQGIEYIEADMRKGRMHRTEPFRNAGLYRSHEAAAAVGNASVIHPVFSGRDGQKWTDFNDLHVLESLDAVASQINAAVAAIRLAPDSPAPSAEVQGFSFPAAQQPIEDSAFEKIPSWVDDAPSVDSLPPPPPPEGAAEIVGLVPIAWALSHCALIQGTTEVWDSVNKLRIKKAAFVAMVGKEAAKQWDAHPERRSISPRNLPKVVRGVAKDLGEAGDDGMAKMLDRYTLLYGTKTVWDAEKKVVVNFDAMALARGELATRWLQHPLRQEKDHDKLVFDPTQKVDPETHINMFEGFQIKPRHDDAKATLVLRLLESLCSTEANGADVFVWVLRWLAYPLQHPGAKMQTALLFFGDKQGTGKSLFFEGIIKPIYGKHGATGGQNQLDANYSAWRSQKLYVLFEEILSRQDKYSSFGLVKHLITGRDTPITQKFKDDRFEANHLNVVMLSNEFQAVPIEPEDRRFQVVEARNPLDLELLAELVAQLDKGLVEAFYDFLLRYPLADFNPHTKPIMTQSKQRMIEFGRPDWEVFYLEWQLGGLSIPYCSCIAEHLFEAYEGYCSRFHFRALSMKKFSELINSRLKRDRQWITLGVQKKRLRTVFHVECDSGETLSQQCNSFMLAANIKDETK